MKWVLQGIYKFFYFFLALYYIYPAKKEKDPIFSFHSWALRLMILTSMIVFYLGGYNPAIEPKNFPKLSECEFAEGIVVRRPYVYEKHGNEPFGLKNEKGTLYKYCRVNCLDNAKWNSLLNRKARLWYWKSWLIRVDIQDELRIYRTERNYEHSKKAYTSTIFWDLFWIIIFPLFLWYTFRCTKKYGRQVYHDTFSIGEK